ncbi:Acid-sensing ion channel 3 [Trichoplax sp. H2]|nr:Acid-sensing ion channel 3 [Trichoplax sp. H2]|eukprot:RDD46192.1 Acid-sensing ion channel 3 [Trichoplax sp. H2]
METANNDIQSTNLEKDFANATSYHGFGQFYKPQTTHYRRYFWMLLTVVATSACILQSSRIVIAAFQYPTKITSKVRYSNSSVFPAVTICNSNYLDKTKMDPDVLAVVNSVFSNYNRSALDLVNLGLTSEIIAARFGQHADYGFFARAFGFKLTDIILECTYHNFNCLNSFTEVVEPNFGLCYQFNAGILQRGGNGNGGNNSSFHRQVGRGPSFGLQLVLDAEQYKYSTLDFFYRYQAGFIIAIHDQFETSSMTINEISVGVGRYTSISLHQTLIEKYLKPRWGECDDQELAFYRKYTREACKQEKESLYVMNLCKCRFKEVSESTVNYTICTTLDTVTCVIPQLDLASRNYRISNSCKIACARKLFPKTISSSSIGTLAYGNILNKRLDLSTKLAYMQGLGLLPSSYTVQDYIRDNIVQLDVFFSDLAHTTVQQEQDITPEEVLSNIGGQLGLFIGVSMLTVCEIVFYIFDKMQYWPQRRNRDNRQTTPVDFEMKKSKVNNNANTIGVMGYGAET